MNFIWKSMNFIIIPKSLVVPGIKIPLTHTNLKVYIKSKVYKPIRSSLVLKHAYRMEFFTSSRKEKLYSTATQWP